MYKCPQCAALAIPFSLLGVTECRACQAKVETRVTYANYLMPAWMLLSITLRKTTGIDLTAGTPVGMLLLFLAGFLQIRLVTYKLYKR